MKKLWLAAIYSLLIFGCQDDLQDSTPAYQAIKDGDELWRAQSFRADIDNGALVVQGSLDNQILTLLPTNDNVGTYVLGGSSLSEAIFEDEDGTVYSTLNPPDPSVSLYPTEGEVRIIDFQNVSNGPSIVTGTFNFTAFTADGLRSVNFIQGEFYKVPLTGGIDPIGGGISCPNASLASANAAADFAATDISMPNYSDLCNAYKDALAVQINSCGDSSGALQAIIDSLGNCVP